MLDSFLKLLNGEKPDEIVWTADITYWMSGRRHYGTAEPAWDTEEGYLQLHKDLGVLPYFYFDKFWVGKAVYDKRVEFTNRQSGNTTRTHIRTPVGEIAQETTYLPESCCAAQTKQYVETESDLDVLLWALEHRHLEPDNLSDYPQRRELWARYDGLPCLGLSRSPLAAFCTEWAGVQNTVYLLADCPDKMARAMALMDEQEEPLLDAVCDLAPPLIHAPDNLSSENTTSLYEDYMFGSHQRRLDRLHEAGVKVAVHLDGAVRGLLPKLTAAGFDAIEALTPAPVGDVTLEDMRQVAGSPSVVLWGGVPGAMFAPPFTWDRMRAHVESLVECWAGEPFVVGVADQVPPDGDIDFCRCIGDVLRGGR